MHREPSLEGVSVQTRVSARSPGDILCMVLGFRTILVESVAQSCVLDTLMTPIFCMQWAYDETHQMMIILMWFGLLCPIQSIAITALCCSFSCRGLSVPVPAIKDCSSCPICTASVAPMFCLIWLPAVMPSKTAASSFSFCLAKACMPSSTVSFVT